MTRVGLSRSGKGQWEVEDGELVGGEGEGSVQFAKLTLLSAVEYEPRSNALEISFVVGAIRRRSEDGGHISIGLLCKLDNIAVKVGNVLDGINNTHSCHLNFFVHN